MKNQLLPNFENFRKKVWIFSASLFIKVFCGLIFQTGEVSKRVQKEG